MKTKPDVRLRWSKREKDILMEWEDGCKSDALGFYIALTRKDIYGSPLKVGKSLLDELKERGYDITTLRISIRKKEVPSDPTS